MPTSRSYSADISTVEKGLEYTDKSVMTATGNVVMSEKAEIIFSRYSNLSRTVASGTTVSNAQIEFGLDQIKTGNNMVNKATGFNVYLRNGEYFAIDLTKIVATANGKPIVRLRVI